MPNISLTNTTSQLAELQRRQKLADMLSAQGNEPFEVQSYKGIQAPISPYAGLAKLLQAYVGSKQASDIEKRRGEIDKTSREEAIRFLTKDIKGSELTKFEDPATAGAKFMPVEQPKPQAINTAVPTLQNPSPSPQMQAAPAPQMYQAPQAPQATAAGNVAPQPEELQRMYLQAALSGNDVLAPIAADRFKSGQATAAALAEDEDFAQKVSKIPGLSDAQKKQIIATRAVNPQAAGNAMGAMLLPEKPEAGPSGVQEYKYAQGQGFKGSYMDFVGAKGAAGRAPPRQAAPGGGGTASGAPGAPAKPGKPATVSEQSAAYNVGRLLRGSAVINNAVTRTSGASAPGALEAAVGSIPLFAKGVNFTRGADRQIVSAAQRDVLDALLYLSTGAAYNKEQLAGQIESYMPAFSDRPETRESKAQRLKQLVFDAKTRAGKAWTPELDQSLNSLFKTTPAPSGGSSAPAGAYSDPAKEAAYQAWKKANKKCPKNRSLSFAHGQRQKPRNHALLASPHVKPALPTFITAAFAKAAKAFLRA